MVAQKIEIQDFLLFYFIFLASKQAKTYTKPWSNSDTHNKNSKQNQNLNPIWKRESDHPQTHCHQIATHIYSNLHKPIVNPSPPTAATINLASIPTTKIQSKTKTHIQFERENQSERKRESEWEKENPTSPLLQTTTLSPSIYKPPRCHRRSSIHTTDVNL